MNQLEPRSGEHDVRAERPDRAVTPPTVLVGAAPPQALWPQPPACVMKTLRLTSRPSHGKAKLRARGDVPPRRLVHRHSDWQRMRDVMHLPCPRCWFRSRSAARRQRQRSASPTKSYKNAPQSAMGERRGIISVASQVHGAGVIAKRGRGPGFARKSRAKRALDAAATMTLAGSVQVGFVYGIICVPIHV